VQYNYNTTAIQQFLSCTAVVLRLCGLLQYNNFFVLFYCSCIVCIALVWTALVTSPIIIIIIIIIILISKNSTVPVYIPKNVGALRMSELEK